jgi:hypothetical protein
MGGIVHLAFAKAALLGVVPISGERAATARCIAADRLASENLSKRASMN